MDYQRIYNQLIQKRQQILVEGYTENHHIIPRCLGGLDNLENLVRLTAREHFIAHQLLAKIYKDNQGLIYSAYRMSTYHKCNINSIKYQWLKENYNNLGGFYHKGKTYEEIMGPEKAKKLKAKRSNHMKKMNELGITGGKGLNNPMHKSNFDENTNFHQNKSIKAFKTRRIKGNDKHTEETKRKISESSKKIHCKKVNLYDLDFNLIKEFSSVRETSIYFKINYGRLSSFIKNNSDDIFLDKFYLRYSK